jgi:hypothetical protein
VQACITLSKICDKHYGIFRETNIINELILCMLTLNLLTTTKVAPPSNASKWQMGFNSAFKGLTLNLLMTSIVAPPSNASKRQMGFNSAFKGLNYAKLIILCFCYCNICFWYCTMCNEINIANLIISFLP